MKGRYVCLRELSGTVSVWTVDDSDERKDRYAVGVQLVRNIGFRGADRRELFFQKMSRFRSVFPDI